MVDPIAFGDADPLMTARRLLAFGVDVLSALGPQKIELIVQSRLAYADALVEALPSWGFEPRQAKQLLRLSLTGRRRAPLTASGGLSITPVAGVDDPQLRQLVIDVMRGEPAEEVDELFQDIAGHARHAHLWHILRHGGEPVGYVLPEFFNEEEAKGAIVHVGVRPRYRGQGLGTTLQSEGLRRLKEHGARTILGSTDLANVPMLRIFEKLKYSPLSKQHYFEYCRRAQI